MRRRRRPCTRRTRKASGNAHLSPPTQRAAFPDATRFALLAAPPTCWRLRRLSILRTLFAAAAAATTLSAVANSFAASQSRERTSIGRLAPSEGGHCVARADTWRRLRRRWGLVSFEFWCALAGALTSRRHRNAAPRWPPPAPTRLVRAAPVFAP